jgi:nucleotide-binding universal stress UspA family protein
MMSEQKGLTILLAVDDSPHSKAAARLVSGIAWPAGTCINVLAAVREPLTMLGLDPEAESALAQTLASTRRTGWAAAEGIAMQVAARLYADTPPELLRVGTVQVLVREGRPTEVVMEQAASLPAELIVVGAKSFSEPSESPLGATAHILANYADCSVLVARPSERMQPLSVVLVADGTCEARRAAEFLRTLNLLQWTEVTVVSIDEVESSPIAGDAGKLRTRRRTPLDTAEARAAKMWEHLCHYGAQPRSTVRCGQSANDLLDIVHEQDADLLVIGTHDQRRVHPFQPGSLPQRLVKYAPCSVLVVR